MLLIAVRAVEPSVLPKKSSVYEVGGTCSGALS